MTREEDAFGQEIWAHYQGQSSFEVIERDDGYFDVSSGARLYFSSHDDWPPHEQKAMERVKGRVLDIGCGAGRHSLHLQEKGFDVLGIDVSPLAIKVCRLRGLKKAEVMSIDQVTFKSNSFDTIIMMGNNFGLFGGLKKARRLLKRFHTMTSQDALIIAETRDPYRTDNPDHLEYQEYNRNRGRMSGQLRLRIRFKRYVTPWFNYLLVSKEELQEILDGTGWKVQGYLDGGNSIYVALMEKR
ncbi:MAG: class I SAM-dependent methyltransferase [Candidatus Bathyarchaeota archaeon]|nr:class I SAM-dependent methyltransferase [Candidatus Bathyarchaeota archaeon]